jgi:excisionase family DNA binding protein
MSETLRIRGNLPRLAFGVGEAAEVLGVSDDYFREHVASELRWVRRGAVKLVPLGELERWLERLRACWRTSSDAERLSLRT